MTEALFYLASSFWLGAVHAATPGHGKTIAAAYIVGVRGRPVDALVLGIFVTLSHTFGIVLVAVLATLGSAWAVPHRVEAYLALATGILVIGIGLWMVRSQREALALALGGRRLDEGHAHDHDHPHDDGHAHDHDHPHDHDHAHEQSPDDHGHAEAPPTYHRHGWGPGHSHDFARLAATGPSLAVLLGLAIAGGILPDPGALAILLAAIASGKLVLGLFTVVVFSVGFASVLVVVGVVAAHVGRVVLTWLESRWVAWLQVGTALLIVGVGVVLTANAWRTVAALP